MGIDDLNYSLTPNTSLIQLWCAQSKLNMDEICSLSGGLGAGPAQSKVVKMKKKNFSYWASSTP